MRPRSAWIVFSVALAVVLGVMVRGTTALLALERERAETEARALLEEQVRLALWRMDTAMTPILSVEMAAGPHVVGSDVPLPAAVKARFALSSTGEMSVHGRLDDARRDELREHLTRSGAGGSSSAITLGMREHVERSDTASQGPVPQQSQSVRNVNEFSKRVGKVADNLEAYQSTIDQTRRGGESDFATDPFEAGPMRALWIGEELVAVRSFRLDSGVHRVGSVLDWGVVRRLLLEESVDLLPDAMLEPARDGMDHEGRQLATLPIALVPGQLGGAPASGWTPLRATVVTGWSFSLLAGLAVALLLRGSLALSERRAAFVSAVTHELRTPLTTFRMYTEMLEQGMVEAKRARYLATLRREAERLGNLVENVLTYARIESDRAPRALEVVAVMELVDRMRERLDQRCTAASLDLELDVAPELENASVRVDAAAVEQIVFNLVDNAAKYAPSTEHPIVRLEARRCAAAVELHVRDYGPGIPPRERRRVFAPFAKGAEHTAGTQPGVGLGLALSRRLARELGGNLELRRPADARPGADFVLTLPLDA